MPNIKISDLEPIAGGFDPDAVFLEAQETVAGEEVSRKISVTEVTAGAGPLAATYVTVTANAILPNERILTAGADIDIVDGGAGGNITISLTAGASYFQLTATGRVIGSDAGTSQTGDNVILGGALAGDVNIADGVIALGQNALAAAVQLDFEGSIAIGRNAGALLDDTRDPWIIIGDGAAANLPGQSFHDGNTIIGTRALGALASQNIQGNTIIGHDAASDMTGASGLGVAQSATVIGFDAGNGNVGASISSSVLIGRNACGDMGVGGVNGSVCIGNQAGESMAGASLNVIIGSNAAINATDIDDSIVIGCNTFAVGGTTGSQIIIGHGSAPGISSGGGEKNILLGSSIGISGAQADFDGCVIIGQGAGSNMIDDQDIFAIEVPQSNTSNIARPFLFGNFLNGNLALLNIAAMTGGVETGSRIVPAWADAAPTAGQGVFSMYGLGTDLAATTDADFVHFYVATADSALTLRYPGGDDVTLLHDGTDSILDNSAGAMVINSAGIEGLRLTGLNSGAVQAPSASVAITANAGGGQVGAVPLIDSYNVVAVSASFNDSVRLPDVFDINSVVIVKNDGANRVAIFPASGDDLGEGVDTLISLPVGSSYAFIATVANSTWTLLDTNIATALLGLNNNGPQIADIQPTDVIPNILPNKGDIDSGLGWTGSDLWGLVAGGVQAIQLRELGGGVVQAPSASLAVTAFAGGGQGSATPLIHSYNVITTVATAGDSVRLPSTFSANALVYIKNDDATEAADVFPASGDDLGAGVDTAVSLAAGDSLTFIGTVNSSTWTQLISPQVGGAAVAGEFDNLLLSQAAGAHVASPTLRFGDGNTGFFESADNILTTSIGGVAILEQVSNGIRLAATNGPMLLNETPSATNAVIIPNKGDGSTGIGQAASNQITLVANNVLGLNAHGVNGGALIDTARQTGITAFAGGGQGSAVHLVNSVCIIDTVATTGDSVRLANQFRAGATISIKNNGANAADVFPSSGDNLGLGIDTAYSLPAGNWVTFMGVTANSVWELWSPDRILFEQANTPTNPAIAFGDGDSGFFEESDDTITVTLGGTAHWDFNFATFRGNAGVSLVDSAPTATAPNIRPGNADNNTGIGSNAADQLSLIAGGIEMLRLVETGVATTDQILLRNVGVGGAVGTPLLAFGDGDTGLFESADDTLNISTAGAIAIQMTGGADVALFNNGVEVARTDTQANGAFEVDSGEGFFRVLNLHDQELLRQDGDIGFATDITSNAVADLTSSLIVTTGQHCIIEGMLRFESASATPGLRWQLDLTGAAVTDSSVAFTLIIAGGTVEGDIEVADVDITHGMAANTEHVYKFFATFTANASILPTIAFAQEVSDATTTRLLDGSWVKYSVVP